MLLDIYFENPLKQGWPTQIGLWAAFGKISKNIDFFGPNFDKNCEKTPKISKNRRVSIQVWAAEILFWAACGPRAAGWPPLL
jgi:hypothetical protein